MPIERTCAGGKFQSKSISPLRDPVRRVGPGAGGHEGDVGEALGLQQRLRDIHRRLAVRGVDEDRKANLRRFRRGLGAGPVGKPKRPAVPAAAAPARKRRRFWMICIGRSPSSELHQATAPECSKRRFRQRTVRGRTMLGGAPSLEAGVLRSQSPAREAPARRWRIIRLIRARREDKIQSEPAVRLSQSAFPASRRISATQIGAADQGVGFRSPRSVGISSETVGWIGTAHCRTG